MLDPLRRVRFFFAPLLVVSLTVIGFFPPSASVAAAVEAKEDAAPVKCCCGGATAECCSKSCCKIDRQPEAPPAPKRPAVRRIELSDAARPTPLTASVLCRSQRPAAFSSAARDSAIETLQSEWVRIQV